MIFDDIKNRKPLVEEEDNDTIFVQTIAEEDPVKDKAVRTFLQSQVEEEEEEVVEEPMEPVQTQRTAAPRRASRPRRHISYDEARQLAAMKLSFYKLFFGLVFVNIIFFGVSWYQIAFTGQNWFVWPLILSSAWLLLKAIRVYLLKGLDIRGAMNMLLERMTQSELERDQLNLDL